MYSFHKQLEMSAQCWGFNVIGIVFLLSSMQAKWQVTATRIATQIGFKTQPWIDKHNCRGSWTYITTPITTTQLEVERSHKGRADHCVGCVSRTKGHPKWSDLRWQEGGDYAADTKIVICLTLLCRWQHGEFFFLKENGYFGATYKANYWKTANSRQGNRLQMLVFPTETYRTQGK